MRTNRTGHSVSLKLFLGALLAACLLATAAHADSLFKGTFTLTNNVYWGRTLLGPGSYSLDLDRGDPLYIVIRDAHTGKFVARQFAKREYKAESGSSELLITVRGNQRVVYSVRLTVLGQGFQATIPLRPGVRTVEEARNAEAIPVSIAKK